jgi:hypothetical protein
MTESAETPRTMSLWVVEGKVDFPVQLRMEPPKPVAHVLISLGGEDPDGFVQMKPLDRDRAASSVFWSPSERIIYEARALVRALEPGLALMRGIELYEHVADRLTLVAGYPVEVVSVGFTYSEDMLRRCIVGELKEYEATTGGEQVFRTQIPRNAHLPSLMMPPPAALEAVRWFRHAMLATRTLDKYLFYHIALESLAKHVPGVERGPRRNPDGEEEGGLESQEAAAIKFLLQRRGLPLEGRKTLATIRARIAHGNTIQRLAADGIGMVCGINPDLFSVMEPSPVLFMAPIGRAQYSAESNPTTSWGGLLGDAHRKYVDQAKGLAPSARESQPSN